MALKMRLSRGGSKGNPFYRIVVTESESRRDGRVTDQVGYYNPVSEVPQIELKMDRVEHWLSKGTIPTVTVKKLITAYKAKTAGK